MGSTSGFSADLNLDELLNVVDNGSGAQTVAVRQAAVLSNLGLTVTQAELNALHGTNPGLNAAVPSGSTLAVTAAMNGKVINLDTAGGSTDTLPPATGSGVKFKFVVTVLATSNNHIIKVANASDFMVGSINNANTSSGNAALAFYAANSGTVATNSDTITLNRGAHGSINVGEQITVTDIAANTWLVEGNISANTTATTPFSAAV